MTVQLRPHLFLALSFTLLGSACTSARYIGSVNGGVFVNRGYGVVARVTDEQLDERWFAIDPLSPEDAPAGMRPRKRSVQIDLDGNGILDVTERVEVSEPTLRLVSKTSTTAHIDLGVTILGGKNAQVPLDALMAVELKRTASSSAALDAAVAKMARRQLAPDFEARVAPVRGRDGRGRPREVRVALIDQGTIQAEEKVQRRQIVRVILYAPQITEAMANDFELFLSGLILSQVASSESTKEQW